MNRMESGFLIMIKQELEGVESTLHQVDGLFKKAMNEHDPAKIERYRADRMTLIRAKDRLQLEYEKEKQSEIEEYERHHPMTTAWHGLKQELDDFFKKYG